MHDRCCLVQSEQHRSVRASVTGAKLFCLTISVSLYVKSKAEGLGLTTPIRSCF